MNEQLAYLKAVIEGDADIEPWPRWFERNSGALSELLGKGSYLRLKRHRVGAIPEILGKFSVPFVRSDRYAWLGGVEGLCRDCGSELVRGKSGSVRCPEGCFRLTVKAARGAPGAAAVSPAAPE